MKRWAGLLFGALFALWGLTLSWKLANLSEGLDFYQFWVGGQEAPHVGEQLWSAETARELQQRYHLRAVTTEGSTAMVRVADARPQLEMFSTPFLYTCFGILPNHYDPAYEIYRIVELLALVAGIVAIGVALRWPPVAVLFFLGFITLMFQPLKAELRVGNVNEVQLLLIALYFVARGRHVFLAGIVLGLAILFKPNLAIALPLVIAYDLAHEEREVVTREAGGALLGAAAAIVVSCLYFHSARVWLRWLGAARSLSQSVLPADSGNTSPVLPLVEAYGPAIDYIVIVVLTIGAAVILIRSREAGPLIAVSIGILLYTLAAPLVWLHYILLAVPLGMILLSSRSPAVKILGGLAMILLAVDPWDALFPIRREIEEARLIQAGLLVLLIGTILALLRTKPHRLKPAHG